MAQQQKQSERKAAPLSSGSSGAPLDPIPGIMWQESVSIFSGGADSGQSLFLAEWFRNWWNGLPINGHTTRKPRGFLHILTHHSWDPLYSALYRRVNLHVERFVISEDYEPSARLWMEGGGLDRAEDIFNICHKRHGLVDRIVAVDKASPGLMCGNPCHPCHAHKSMAFYRELATTYHCTIILLLGAAKLKADGTNRYARGRERFYGSAELAEHADLNIWLNDETDPITLGWKPVNQPEWACSFHVDSKSGLFVPAVGDHGPTVATDRPSQLVEHIPDGGIRYTELVRHAALQFDVSERTIKRHIDVLRERGLVYGEGGKLHRRKVS